MRLIDADALKKAIPNTHVDIFENCRNCRLLDDEQVKQLIDDTPTIALLKEQEAKTGHWVSVNDGDAVVIDNDGFPERACYCSECKKYLIASDEYAVYGRYCPFCGAKMKGR